MTEDPEHHVRQSVPAVLFFAVAALASIMISQNTGIERADAFISIIVGVPTAAAVVLAVVVVKKLTRRKKDVQDDQT